MPASACAGASDLNAAASPRKKAFMATATANKKIKNVLWDERWAEFHELVALEGRGGMTHKNCLAVCCNFTMK